MINDIPINNWANLQSEEWHALVLGNGASISIHKEFAYATLHGVADKNGLLPTTSPLFEKLGTTDFEHVLLACWYAQQVAVAMDVAWDDVKLAYMEVRSALVQVVHDVHPIHAQVASELELIGKFASRFSIVASLNYDLMLYWAIMQYNLTHGLWFKDAFIEGEFDTGWRSYLQMPHDSANGTTMVFYPHGNLAVARHIVRGEIKTASSSGFKSDLLQTITGSWETGHCVPVFVSEGTSESKLAAIQRSRYLTHVYESVLPKLGRNIVVYGWGFAENDRHVLDAILKNRPEQIAVSILTTQTEADQQAYCHHVLKAVRRISQTLDVVFFDSRSPGCWNNPKQLHC